MVSQAHGKWGTAHEVPGLTALNTGLDATITSVSCASAGNCSAGGYYGDSPNTIQAFVVTQARGRWGTAQEIPGTAALNTYGNAMVQSVSCASAGNCAAAGIYADADSHDGGNRQAFVVRQVHSNWGTAHKIPGLAALNTADYAQLSSLLRPSGRASIVLSPSWFLGPDADSPGARNRSWELLN